jgi:hypothetical protein
VVALSAFVNSKKINLPLPVFRPESVMADARLAKLSTALGALRNRTIRGSGRRPNRRATMNAPAANTSSRLIDTAFFNVGIMRVFIPAAV